MEMTKKLDKILADHKAWLKDNTKGKRADLSDTDLIGADLRGTNLCNANLHLANLCGADLYAANLCGANLHDANLHLANLHGADLHGADLGGADLGGADLYAANLCGANLHDANLLGADLREANIDYSVWPLYCGSLSPKIDKRIAAQLLYHVLCAMRSCADDPEVAAVLNNKDNINLANKFHKAGECGIIKPTNGEKKGGAK